MFLTFKGLEGVLRTEEDVRLKSVMDTRHLSLVSKGCQLISFPAEVLKKHADLVTLRKIKKHIKTYPSDDQLLECYLEKSHWNTYKEVLLSKTVKEIEARRSLGKLRTYARINDTFRYGDRKWCTVDRDEASETHGKKSHKKKSCLLSCST